MIESVGTQIGYAAMAVGYAMLGFIALVIVYGLIEATADGIKRWWKR